MALLSRRFERAALDSPLPREDVRDELTGGTLGRRKWVEDIWRPRARMAKTRDQDEPLCPRLKGCVRDASYREEREGEQRPGTCTACPENRRGL